MRLPLTLDDRCPINHRDATVAPLILRRLHDYLERSDLRGVELGLAVTSEFGADLARLSGDLTSLWSALATLGAHDLQTARTVEPDLDARLILREAGLGGLATAASTWGVYAAEGPGGGVHATTAASGQVRLDGIKPWCSLAGQLDNCLMTAWAGKEQGLYAVDLGDSGVQPVEADRWISRGLPDIVSTSLVLNDVEVTPVGEPSWYLQRPGFWWGGVGVAAIWYGAAVRLARELVKAAATRAPDQVALMHVGRCEVALHQARLALLEAAALSKVGVGLDAASGTAMLTRQIVFDAAETVLRTCDHAMGPGPLTANEEYAGMAASLHLYLRQHHAERDTAALGKWSLGSGGR